MAEAQGLSIFQAVLISSSNLTSAGQFAGLTVIAACATIREMILTQLVLSCLFAWVPQLNRVSDGLAIVICTVVAAEVFALLFPVNEEDAP